MFDEHPRHAPPKFFIFLKLEISRNRVIVNSQYFQTFYWLRDIAIICLLLLISPSYHGILCFGRSKQQRVRAQLKVFDISAAYIFSVVQFALSLGLRKQYQPVLCIQHQKPGVNSINTLSPTMNIFRLVADLSHMASHLILLYLIHHNKSIEGLSLKTQVLYVVVFVLRYADVFTSFISLYNTFMKFFFVASSAYTVYLMTNKYQKSIRNNIDTFPVKYLVIPLAILSVIFTRSYSIREVTWSFSIWLESVAIIPQLYMLQRTGSAENITIHYIFALGIYRALYIPNWIYRYFFDNFFDYISVLAGILQTIVYSDFFYIYYTKVMQGKSFELPV